MDEPLGEITVVREKDEAFGLRVEPPHIEEPGQFLGQKIEDCIARVSIFSCRNETRRFVQHDGERWIGMNKFAIHFHVIARSRLRAEVCADLAVDPDAASRD